jgi:hypothetical protein
MHRTSRIPTPGRLAAVGAALVGLLLHSGGATAAAVSTSHDATTVNE